MYNLNRNPEKTGNVRDRFGNVIYNIYTNVEHGGELTIGEFVGFAIIIILIFVSGGEIL